MDVKFLDRSIWQRLFGICATKEPVTEKSWTYHSGELIIDLNRVPDLTIPGSALRFEGGSLPVRVLIVYGQDEEYRAFHNRCTHFGHRRLDYVPGTDTIQCCSINKSTYTFAGKKIHGPNPKPVAVFPVEKKEDQLHIRLT